MLIYELLSGDAPFKGASEDPWETFRRVLSGRFFIPPFMGPLAADIIYKLLQVNPDQRLGSGPGGAAEVRVGGACVGWLLGQGAGSGERGAVKIHTTTVAVAALTTRSTMVALLPSPRPSARPLSPIFPPFFFADQAAPVVQRHQLEGLGAAPRAPALCARRQIHTELHRAQVHSPRRLPQVAGAQERRRKARCRRHGGLAVAGGRRGPQPLPRGACQQFLTLRTLGFQTSIFDST